MWGDEVGSQYTVHSVCEVCRVEGRSEVAKVDSLQWK